MFNLYDRAYSKANMKIMDTENEMYSRCWDLNKFIPVNVINIITMFPMVYKL